MGLLSDFLSGVDDRPYPDGHPDCMGTLFIPLLFRDDLLVYDEDGAIIGIQDEVLERVEQNIPAFERGHHVQVHDWSILFPPTIRDGVAFTQIEYTVTKS